MATTNKILKITIAGTENSGKSALMKRYTDDTFLSTYITTIGVEFSNKTINDIKLQVWDTSGQERFLQITTSYYKNAKAIILCYDITNQESFDKIPGFLTIAKNLAKDNPKIILVGTHADEDNERVVNFATGQNFANDNQLDHFVEVSAKTGLNVDDLFNWIATNAQSILKIEATGTTVAGFVREYEKDYNATWLKNWTGSKKWDPDDMATTMKCIRDYAETKPGSRTARVLDKIEGAPNPDGGGQPTCGALFRR